MEKDFQVTLTLRLPLPIASRLRELAAADCRPASSLARRLLMDGLARTSARPPKPRPQRGRVSVVA